MQKLLQLTEKEVRNNTAITKSENPAPHTNVEQWDGISHALPRVHTIQPLVHADRRITSNMTKYNPLVPRLPSPISSKGVDAARYGARQPPTQKSNDDKNQEP